MFWQSAAVAALAVTGVQAGIVGLVAEGMKRGSPATEQRMREIAQAHIAARGFLELRQIANQTTTSSTGTPGVTMNADGTINMTAWDAAVTTACTNALNLLSTSTNPSGTCVCYNVMSLNEATGVFAADLRLFSLSTATGDFAGIAPENVKVQLNYNGAQATPVSNSTIASMAITARNNNLRLLQAYLFQGQIDATQLAAIPAESNNTKTAKLEQLVMPTITLSATNSAGVTVSTNVSTNEAAFVTGKFSDQVIMSNTALAQKAVDTIVNQLHNGTVAFMVPGITLMLAPIGLVVTSVWLAIGLAFYGLGTVERIGHADAFKRRAMVAKKPASQRI